MIERLRFQEVDYIPRGWLRFQEVICQEIEIPRDDQLLPFCIYYYEDNHTGTIYCHIGAPELSVDKDGKNPRYKCFHESLIYNGWYSYGAFYSLDPQFRPIPNGMILLCARWRRGFPWQTFEISNARDPFNLQQDLFSECLYFYAYSSPAKNTVPLYFFMSGFFGILYFVQFCAFCPILCILSNFVQFFCILTKKRCLHCVINILLTRLIQMFFLCVSYFKLV